MTKTLEAVVRRRWLPPEYAVREVVAFERRFGEKHLALACHAALPLILTPELVNLIRINFLDGEDIPWIAESDLLLSPLCRPIQEGIYEVEPTIREVLIVELEDKFGWEKPFQLAEFLEFYLEKQPDWKQRPELTRTQKWIAQAYLDPDSTVREIKDRLDKILSPNNPVLGLADQSYIPHLVEILAEPLEHTNLWDEHQYLVNTTHALSKLLSGGRKGLREEIGLKEVNNNVGEGEEILISPAITKLVNSIEPITIPKVFISYSHDSLECQDRVLNLANRLRSDGIDCNIDQYEESPGKGWARWMLDQLEWADFVLVVCTETYNRRFRGQEEPGKGKGVTWEGAVISQELYDAQANSTKFIPVIFDAEDGKHIPIVVRGFSRYKLKLDSEADYENLYRRLTNQPNTPKPQLGSLRELTPRDRKQNFFEPEKPPTPDNRHKAKFKSKRFFAYDDEWVGRENLINDLSNRVKESCRLLILVGITGIGKTALGERLAIELEDWFDSNWDNYLKEDFDNEEQPYDFASVAARLLEKCGEPVTPEDRKDTQRLLNRLVIHLQENRYLVQIDSLEIILEGNEEEGWNDFKDEWWIKFFASFLEADSCKSSIILTSQDFPAQIITIGGRYPNFWQYQLVSGLEKAEQLALFKKVGLDVSDEAENQFYLERIGQAYEGHPLALRVITREIVNRPFNKNIKAYWQKYGKEVEEVEKAIEEAKIGGVMASADDAINLHRYTRNLRKKVKTRLESAFNRLRKDSFNAYLLLCESSVYRSEVTEEFWLSHLEDWDIEEEEQYKALDSLRDRFLVEEMVDESDRVMVRQHNLIRGVSLEHLRRLDEEEDYDESIIEIPPEGEFILTKLGIESAFIKSIKDIHKRTHYRAIINWLIKYKPNNASDFDSLRGLIESFRHLCEIEDWETARKILVFRLETPTKEELYNQLGTWGYYREQIELCNRLLGKLNFNLDIKLLATLGNSYYALGNYSQSIDHLQQSLSIAKQNNSSLETSNILSTLGKVNEALGNYSQAINYLEQSLSIARDNNSHKEEIKALSNLAIVYYDTANYSQSINYSEQSIRIARQIKDIQTEGIALGNLGNIYLAQGEYKRAIECYQQSLAIAREIGDRFNEGRCIATSGNIYLAQGEYKRAIECYQQSLAIAKEIGDSRNEGIVLGSIGNTYNALGEYQRAIDYYQQSLNIAKEIGDRRNEGIVLGSIGNTYNALGEYQRAIKYYQQSLNIAKEIGDRLNESIYMLGLSNAYDQLGRYQEVIDLQPQLREIARQIQRPDFNATALDNLGNAYLSLGRYREAIKSHEAAMTIAIELQDSQKISGCLNNLGNAYYFLQEYQTAEQYFEQYLTAARELNNPEKEAGALLSIANCYREQQQYRDSIPYYQQSLTIAEEFGYRRLKASIQGGLGVALKNTEKYSEAVECYKKSLSLEQEIGNRQGEATVLGNLGVVYRLIGDYQTAISYQEKALAICAAVGDKHGEGRAYINLGNVYEESSNINKAFLYRIKGILVFHELKIEKQTRQLLTNYFPSLVSVISQFEKNEEIDEEIEIASYTQIYTEQIARIINLDINKLNADLDCNAIEKIVELIIYYFRE